MRPVVFGILIFLGLEGISSATTFECQTAFQRIEDRRRLVEFYLERITKTPVLVVGDLMLDHSIYGEGSKRSPEANVPDLSKCGESFCPGGAANVAMNLKSLGAPVKLIGVVGVDRSASTLKEILIKNRFDLSGFVLSLNRPTTTKMRIISNGDHFVRLSDESREPISDSEAEKLLKEIQRAHPSVIVISDYGKGIFRPDFTQTIIAHARAKGIPVIVDPKGTDYSKYAGAWLIKPNRKEAEEALKISLRSLSDEDLVLALQQLKQNYNLSEAMITLSERGLGLLDQAENFVHLPAQASEVVDVTGAGDTVTAVTASALGARMNLVDAAWLASRAAAIAVHSPGTYAVTPKDLLP